jgi:uncharacterized membrane protein YfcA
LEPTLFAVVFIAMIAAGCVKGVIGLGLPLTSIAIMGTVMDLRQAIPLIVVPILVTNIYQAMQGGQLAAQFRRFWSMNLLLCAGTWGGTVLLFIIDPAALVITLGCVVVGYALINLFSVTIRVPAKNEGWMSPVIGLISGILTGTTGSVGAPIAIYMQALGLEKAAFLQAVSLSFFITAVVWIAALIDQSAFNLQTTVVSLFAVIPAFVGMWTGQVLRDRLPEDKFRHWIFVFLIVVGANLIRKGIG